MEYVGARSAAEPGSGQMKTEENLNLQDETEWRTRTLKSSNALRSVLTELGAWLAALVIAFQLDPKWPRFHFVLALSSVMLVRMLSSHYDDRKKLRAIARYQKRGDSTQPE